MASQMFEGLSGSPDHQMGLVEILEPHDRAYFTAFLVDIHESGKQNLVRYVNETDPTWVDAARVRARPPPMTPQEMAEYDPPEGARVEVLFTDEQESWWEGEVRQKKGGFYVINFPDEGEMETSEVVERERLRPRSGHTPSGFIRRIFRIPAGQEKNVELTKDQLPKIAKHAEIFVLNLSPDGKNLIGIGMPRTLDTISTLLEIHYKQLPRMAHLALQEERLNGKLKQTEEQKNFGSSVNFRVQAEHMGMVIGAHGNNIKKAQALPGVHLIEVRHDNSVIVFADKREQAEAARDLLEIVVEKVPEVDFNEEAGVIIGKNGQQIRELQSMSSCNINVDQQTRCITITGTRVCVGKARALILYTIEQLRDTRKKERELQEMAGELLAMGGSLGGTGMVMVGGGRSGFNGGFNGMGATGGMMRGRGRGGPMMRGRGAMAGGMVGGGVKEPQQQTGRGGGNVMANGARGNGMAREAVRGGVVARGGRGGAVLREDNGVTYSVTGVQQPPPLPQQQQQQQQAQQAQQQAHRGGRGGKQAQPQPQQQQQAQTQAQTQPQQQAQQGGRGGKQAQPAPQQPAQAQPQPQQQAQQGGRGGKQAQPAPQQPAQSQSQPQQQAQQGGRGGRQAQPAPQQPAQSQSQPQQQAQQGGRGGRQAQPAPQQPAQSQSQPQQQAQQGGRGGKQAHTQSTPPQQHLVQAQPQQKPPVVVVVASEPLPQRQQGGKKQPTQPVAVVAPQQPPQQQQQQLHQIQATNVNGTQGGGRGGGSAGGGGGGSAGGRPAAPASQQAPDLQNDTNAKVTQNGASAETGGDRDAPSLRAKLANQGKAPVGAPARGAARGGSRGGRDRT